MTEGKPQPQNRRTWWIVGLGLALAWIVYLRLWGPRGLSGDLPHPRLENSSPDARGEYAWTLMDLEGKRLDFTRYRGRAVFLNVWATWCPPCVAELPAIAHLAANPALKDVAFVCVSIDEDLEAVRRFARTRDLRQPVFWTPAETLPGVFQTPGIPATFVIAPDGRIVVAQVGAAQWDDPAVVDFLKALAQPSSIPAAGPVTRR